MPTIRQTFLFCLILIPLATSCSIPYRVILGINPSPEWTLEEEIVELANKYEIPAEYSWTLDTVTYFANLRELYSKEAKEIQIIDDDSTELFLLKEVLKDDTQPVQFRLFDKNGTEIFKLVNCYVEPPIPMNWNVEGCFDVFPPVIDEESLGYHYFDLDFLLSASSPINGEKLTLSELPEAEYYGVVLWNDYFVKPSRKLIKTVTEYIEDSGESVQLIFINNQHACIWQIIDSADKERVKEFYRNEKQ